MAYRKVVIVSILLCGLGGCAERPERTETGASGDCPLIETAFPVDTTGQALRSETWRSDGSAEGATATLYPGPGVRRIVRAVFLGETGRATYVYSVGSTSYVAVRRDTMYVPIPGSPPDSIAVCASNATTSLAGRFSEVLIEAMRALGVPRDSIGPAFLADGG